MIFPLLLVLRVTVPRANVLTTAQLLAVVLAKPVPTVNALLLPLWEDVPSARNATTTEDARLMLPQRPAEMPALGLAQMELAAPAHVLLFLLEPLHLHLAARRAKSASGVRALLTIPERDAPFATRAKTVGACPQRELALTASAMALATA
jgi:hypothetical protein